MLLISLLRQSPCPLLELDWTVQHYVGRNGSKMFDGSNSKCYSRSVQAKQAAGLNVGFGIADKPARNLSIFITIAHQLGFSLCSRVRHQFGACGKYAVEAVAQMQTLQLAHE